MPKLDPTQAALHRKLWNKYLDELDIEIVKEIMGNPHGDAARLLNNKVEAAMRATLDNELKA